MIHLISNWEHVVLDREGIDLFMPLKLIFRITALKLNLVPACIDHRNDFVGTGVSNFPHGIFSAKAGYLARNLLHSCSPKLVGYIWGTAPEFRHTTAQS